MTDAERLAQIRQRYFGLQGDMPPFGDVLTLLRLLAARDATIADLERRLAEARADVVRGFANAILHGSDEHRAWLLDAAEAYIAGAPMPSPRPVDAPPRPVAEASGEFGHPAPRNFDKERPGPGWKISDDTQRELQEMEQQQRESVARLRSAPQPTADHTERARELYFAATHNYRLSGPMPSNKWVEECATALTAAERAGVKDAINKTTPGWRDLNVALKMVRDAVYELGPVEAIPARDAGPPNYIQDAEDIIAGIQRVEDQAERAGAEKMRERCKHIANIAADLYDDRQGCFESGAHRIARQIADDIEGIKG
jgi:hypothetical protein